MIYFKIMVDNPWCRSGAARTGHDYYWKDVRLSTNKNFEIQISRFPARHILDIGLDLRWYGSDHQGPELDINLLGFMFNVKVYDSRHWNYEENRWMTREEAESEEEVWRSGPAGQLGTTGKQDERT